MLIQNQPTWRQLPQQQHRWKYSGCDCCLQPCEDCIRCDVGATPAQFALSVSSITNASCSNCDRWNGDWILTQQCLVVEGGDSCRWQTPIEADAPCDISCAGCSRWALILGSSFAVLLADENNMAGYRLAIGSFDCATSNVLTLNTASLRCNWPATLTVTPV